MSGKWEHFRLKRRSSPTVGDIKKVLMSKIIGEEISYKKALNEFSVRATTEALEWFEYPIRHE